MKKFITFIIPSIGRDTLLRTLQSLTQQTYSNWNAIVGFDGISLSELSFQLPEDDRIKYLFFDEKVGELRLNGHNGKAGEVRNKIISQCNSEWIAFVDDDDSIHEDYVKNFKHQLNNQFDLFIYRMITTDGRIIPAYNTSLCEGNVGISFIVNFDFVLRNNIKFTNSNIEDFKYIIDVHNAAGKIAVSNDVAYKVSH